MDKRTADEIGLVMYCLSLYLSGKEEWPTVAAAAKYLSISQKRVIDLAESNDRFTLNVAMSSGESTVELPKREWTVEYDWTAG